MRHIRKSQMEILGLAFVFIILIFGLIIFLRLGVSSEGGHVSPDRDNLLAASFISSILKTSVECGQHIYSVNYLLRDCVSANRIVCEGRNSCVVANETITDILSQTLVQYQRSYRLNISYAGQDPVILNYTSNCRERSPGIFYRQPFDVSGLTLNINLRICDFA